MKRLGALKAWVMDPWPIFAVAMVPVGYGVVCVATRHAWLMGAKHGVRSMVVEGPRAVLGGMGYVALGLFLHSFKFPESGSQRSRGVRALVLAYRVLTMIVGTALIVWARQG